MSLQWRPRFVYAATDITLLLPVRPWDFLEHIVGGEAESGANVIAAFVVRRDQQLALPLRFYEEEWPVVRALIEYGQTGLPIEWFPDVDDPDLSFDIYLDAPEVGEQYDAEPDNEYPRAVALTVVVRRVDGLGWDDLGSYFDLVIPEPEEPEPEPDPVYTLSEVASGLLARHDYDGAAPFVLANWTFMTGSSGAISGGALRITMNTGAIRYARYDLLAGRGKTYVQGVVRGVTVVGSNLQIGIAAHMEAGGSPDSAVNVRYSMARAGSDVVATQSQLNGVNDASVVTNIAARVVAVDHRLSLFVDGDDYIGYDHTSTVEQNATGAPVTGLITGQLGIAGNSGGGNGGVCDVRRLYAMSDRYITVSGLPAGSTVNVLDGASVVIVSGAAVAGAVSLDVWKKVLPAVTIEVRDASAVLLDTLSPAGGIWGGSQFLFTIT